MYTSLEDREKLYRTIYEVYDETPRIKTKRLSKQMKLRPSKTGKRVKEAIDQGYIIGPQVRKKSYKNLKERMYFINDEDPFELYEKYKKDKNVVYHAIMKGFANFWAISKEEITIRGNVVAEGFRSDYLFSFAPNCSWGHSMQNIRKKVKNFRPEEYTSTSIIETHYDEPIEWDEKDEILFNELKYNFRKPLTPLMTKHRISKDKIEQWFERLPECCTVFTCYFPETISAYDPYIFMFETDYEDFIVELFSELPTTTSFFKVSDKLFLHLNIDRGFMRNANSLKPNLNRLGIPLLVRDLLKRGIIKSQADAIVQSYWREDLESD